MPETSDITVLVWNVFHGQDGARLGPTLGSIVRRRPLVSDTHVHLNRKWTDEMCAVIRAQEPTVVALQEVSPQAVGRIAEQTGMHAVRSVMRPVIGPLRVRGWLADRNPDLWRTHEGTSNVVLAHPDWTPTETWTLRHNPPLFTIREGHRLRLDCKERLHWMMEPRRLVGTRLRHTDGRTLSVISLHCHNSLVWDAIATEVVRILPTIEDHLRPDEPALLAGDLNSAGSHHPAIAAILAAGFEEPTVDDLVLDHIFHRNLEVVSPPAALDPSVRQIRGAIDGVERAVLLSDHDVVRGVYRFPHAVI